MSERAAQRLIVLRDATVPHALERAGEEESGPRLVVEFEDANPAERVDLAADPAVVATGAVMPTRLIAPVATSQVGSASGSVWGVEEVGAAASGYTGQGVSVAVLDTGVDGGHAAFAGLTVLEQDFTNSTTDDRVGHGTHCAGTAVGREVSGVRIGVAPGTSRLLAGKILDEAGFGTTEMLFEGLNWAVMQGADVVSLSLGFDFPGLVAAQVADGWPVDLATSEALAVYTDTLRLLEAMIRVAQQREVVVVAAAGNESQRDVDVAHVITASLPAAATDVVSVAAAGLAGQQLAVAPFSNVFAKVSAPGVDIVSAEAGGGLISMSGTSMAGPHVAGVAALWWEAVRNEGLPTTAAVVISKLIATARPSRFAGGAGGAGVADRGAGMVTAP